MKEPFCNCLISTQHSHLEFSRRYFSSFFLLAHLFFMYFDIRRNKTKKKKEKEEEKNKKKESFFGRFWIIKIGKGKERERGRGKKEAKWGERWDLRSKRAEQWPESHFDKHYFFGSNKQGRKIKNYAGRFSVFDITKKTSKESEWEKPRNN